MSSSFKYSQDFVYGDIQVSVSRDLRVDLVGKQYSVFFSVLVLVLLVEKCSFYVSVY